MSVSPDHSENRDRRAVPAAVSLALRDNVRTAVRTLGDGFLASADATLVASWFATGSLTPEIYYRDLLRTVYRLMFLLIAERRELLHLPLTDPSVRQRYHYTRGFTRISTLTEDAYVASGSELWQETKEVFLGLAHGDTKLGLVPLGGIFVRSEHPIFTASLLLNRTLVEVARLLTFVPVGEVQFPVDWAAIAGEELGSLYEQLLELTPEINVDSAQFQLGGTTNAPTTRRSSGSYYTPSELVREVLENALERRIADTLANNPDAAAASLLRLKLVDPACGCGHFLLAAARRLATCLEPYIDDSNHNSAIRLRALRLVIPNCIYGVDLNATAIELCKVNLWLEMAEPGVPLSFLDAHIQQGNALIGAPPTAVAAGIPKQAWSAHDKSERRELAQRNRTSAERATIPQSTALHRERSSVLANVWTAAFFWPKANSIALAAAPTNDVWCDLLGADSSHHDLTLQITEQLASTHRFFHWHLRFPEVFEAGGFDVVLGNPPWIAHAGRAAQPLDAGVKHFYASNYPAFSKYITTHGLFASVLPTVLRPGGYLGFVLPSSLSELAGYEPTRKAHDALCTFVCELTDFGEGRFEGVTQPCMALVTKRDLNGRSDAVFGEPWPVARPDLSPADHELMQYLRTLTPLPPELFAERGLQSDPTLRSHFVDSAHPTDRFTVPIREGTDVREFELMKVRFHVDPQAMGKHLRPSREFEQVSVVVRQTARYPIAAISDGVAFRNSLLAGLRHPEWPAQVLVALLNSTLVRWHHYMRFRDARQPVLPQVKISHLRAIPQPPSFVPTHHAELTELGALLSAPQSEAAKAQLRARLDRAVAQAFGLSPDQAALLARWRYA